ncbi:addiction module antitoxin [Pseudomonas syringae]|uniref:Addiction module antitoxin n=1 Tax=Pseudomonas syringae TaxID=317 RepID=A0A1C7Z205_PSESX|nr:type II toxin-antitoxin system ParD family antitoxin [Pseudomonas syringae]OCR22558.1 addiction module antitoxin [Pseudomonas syringae]
MQALTRSEPGIVAEIDAERSSNDSEYIRDLIRREQERSAELEAVRFALIEGESSGEPRPFSADDFKKKMLTAHG